MSDGYFTPDTGEVDIWNCDLCGTPANATRNVIGPRGFAAAMAKQYVSHDVFECPHRKEDWHQQVSELKREQRKTKSLQVRTTLQTEIDLILEARETTL